MGESTSPFDRATGANSLKLKHPTALSLIDSGGLRVWEAVNLRPRDSDGKRKARVIRPSQGNKDPQVPLAHPLKDPIQRTLDAYRPTTFLFEGATGGPYTCWKAGRTCASSKQSWATPAQKPRRSTPMYPHEASRTSKTPSINATIPSHHKETVTVTHNHPPSAC